MSTNYEVNFGFKINLREVIPLLQLPSSINKEISTWDLKQYKNLVLFFNHGTKCNYCWQKIKALDAIYPKLKGLETEVLAVSFDNVSDLKEKAAKDNIKFPLLSDANNRYTMKFTYIDNWRNSPYPSIFITDRYGELREQEIKVEADQLMNEVDIVSKIFAIEIECPECSYL